MHISLIIYFNFRSAQVRIYLHFLFVKDEPEQRGQTKNVAKLTFNPFFNFLKFFQKLRYNNMYSVFRVCLFQTKGQKDIFQKYKYFAIILIIINSSFKNKKFVVVPFCQKKSRLKIQQNIAGDHINTNFSRHQFQD